MEAFSLVTQVRDFAKNDILELGRSSFQQHGNFRLAPKTIRFLNINYLGYMWQPGFSIILKLNLKQHLLDDINIEYLNEY